MITIVQLLWADWSDHSEFLGVYRNDKIAQQYLEDFIGQESQETGMVYVRERLRIQPKDVISD